MSDTVAAGQLRAFVERIERIESEIKDLNADKSEIYKELRGFGFDVKAVRQCVSARKLDSSELQERNAVFDMYWEALTGASHVHVHEEQPETANEAVRFDSGSLTEIEVKTQVQVLPGVAFGDAKGGSTGMERSDGGERPAPIPEPFEPPAFLVKERKPLRPLCLNPSECAGYGTHTCHRCLKASGQAEVAA
jgi:uncharacterized protein (UPF0335 family)